MAKTVVANGKTFTFDDEATNEQIGDAIDEYFSGQAEPLKKKEDTNISATEPSAPSLIPVQKPSESIGLSSLSEAKINVPVGERGLVKKFTPEQDAKLKELSYESKMGKANPDLQDFMIPGSNIKKDPNKDLSIDDLTLRTKVVRDLQNKTTENIDLLSKGLERLKYEGESLINQYNQSPSPQLLEQIKIKQRDFELTKREVNRQEYLKSAYETRILQTSDSIKDIANDQVPEDVFSGIYKGFKGNLDSWGQASSLALKSKAEQIQFAKDMALQAPTKEQNLQGEVGEMIGGVLPDIMTAIGFSLIGLPNVGAYTVGARQGAAQAADDFVRAFNKAKQGVFTGEIDNKGNKITRTPSDDEAYDIATKAAGVGGVTGFAEGVVGAKFQNVLGEIATRKVTSAGKKILIEKALDTGLDAVVAGGMQTTRNVFDRAQGLDTKWHDGVLKNMAGEALLSTPINLVSGIKAAKNIKLQEKQKSAIYDAVENNQFNPEELDKLNQNIEVLKNRGVISPEEHIAIKKKISDYQRVIPTIPDEVENKKEVANLIVERDDLESQKESVDKAFQAPIEEKINDINKKIEEVSTQPTTTDIQQPMGEGEDNLGAVGDVSKEGKEVSGEDEKPTYLNEPLDTKNSKPIEEVALTDINKGDVIVGYHSTPTGDIDTGNELGIHIGTKDVAENINKGKRDGKGVVKKVAFKPKKPLILGDMPSWSSINVLTELLRQKFTGIDRGKLEEIRDSDLTEKEKQKQVIELVKEQGFDAIAYQNFDEGNGEYSYVLFDKTQLKEQGKPIQEAEAAKAETAKVIEEETKTEEEITNKNYSKIKPAKPKAKNPLIKKSLLEIQSGKKYYDAVRDNDLTDEQSNELSKDFAESDIFPKKQFGKKDKIANDFDPNDNIDVKPIDKPIKTRKSKIESIGATVSKDEMRPAMQGVFHDAENGRLVTTDSHKLVIIEDKSIKKTEIIDPKTGKVIDAKFPNYDAVIPKDNPIKRKVKVKEWLAQLNGLVESKKFFEKPIAVRIKIGEQEFAFNSELMRDVFNVMAEQGVTEVELQLSQPNRVLVIESNKGVMGLLMPFMLEKSTDTYNSPQYRGGLKTLLETEITIAEKNGIVQKDIDYLEKRKKDKQNDLKEALSEVRNAKNNEDLSSANFSVEYEKKRIAEIDVEIEEKKSQLIDNPLQEKEDLQTIKKSIENGEITEKSATDFIERPTKRTRKTKQSIEAIESKAESDSEVELNEAIKEAAELIKGETEEPKLTPKTKEEAPALRDVESTAKALEGKDISKIKYPRRAIPTHEMVAVEHAGYEAPRRVTAANKNEIQIQGYGTTPTTSFLSRLIENGRLNRADFKKGLNIRLSEEYATKLLRENEDLFPSDLAEPKAIAEAYHKAKADGSNPELIKAVESLLSKEQAPPASDVESTAKEQMSDNDLQGLVGRDVFKQIQRSEEQLGEGVVDRNRMIETAKQIQKADKKDKLLPEHIFEALQYETGFPDNWQDLRNAIKRGGIDVNSEAVQRQIEVGVKLPKDIVEEFKKSERYKNANPELVKAVESLLSKEQAPPASDVPKTLSELKRNDETTQSLEKKLRDLELERTNKLIENKGKGRFDDRLKDEIDEVKRKIYKRENELTTRRNAELKGSISDGSLLKLISENKISAEDARLLIIESGIEVPAEIQSIVDKNKQNKKENKQSIIERDTDFLGNEKEAYMVNNDKANGVRTQDDVDYYKANVKRAIDKGQYEKDIADGKMTANDAKIIIESYGLKVPKAVESPLSKEQAPASEPTPTQKLISDAMGIFYELKDGKKSSTERRILKEKMNEMLSKSPKIKYIFDNIQDINKELGDNIKKRGDC